MGFSDNLRAVRREKNLSQEQLAEMLNVSRQSVSKWEQDSGYPEIEKIVQLAQKLDISLDALLLDKKPAITENTQQNTAVFPNEKKITVQSYDGGTLAAYSKFTITPILLAGKNEPKYVLSGSAGKYNLWGEFADNLGWYASREDAQKELTEICAAMNKGEATYQLKYYAKVKSKAFGMKLDSESD